MRTIKELLEMLRQFIPENIITDMGGSICYSIMDMYYNDLINKTEETGLLKYIESNRPPECIEKQNELDFWWPYGELTPRLEFLDKLIAEL